MSVLMKNEQMLAGLVPSDSGWQTTTAVNGNTLKYRKIGNQVWLKKGTAGTLTAGAWNTVANLPDGFRPATNLVDCTYYKLPTYQTVLILSTGAVQIVADTASIYDFCISFLVD